MRVDSVNSRSRIFTSEEEEEFLAFSRTPNLYEEFAQSIAPQIYGSGGKYFTVNVETQIFMDNQLNTFFKTLKKPLHAYYLVVPRKFFRTE
jgi:hypothetical protein